MTIAIVSFDTFTPSDVELFDRTFGYTGGTPVELVRLPAAPTEIVRTTLPVANPVLSPDGTRVMFQMMPREDWELFPDTLRLVGRRIIVGGVLFALASAADSDLRRRAGRSPAKGLSGDQSGG